MDIGIFKPRALSFEENNPFLKAQSYSNNLEQQKLMNAIRAVQAKYAEPEAKASLDLNQLKPEELRQNIAKLGLENKWYGPKEQADIDYKKYLSSGGSSNGGKGGNSGIREEAFFQSLISKDNPQLKGDPDKIYEASNVIRAGGDSLSDGTKLNPLSPASHTSLERLAKGTTFAGIANPLAKAEASEAESKVMVDLAMEDAKPYLETYFGYSIPQIMDTFETDEKSQKRLGNFIASQAAQYEIAQIRNRIAQGEPGITATQELMGKSQQIINAKYPRLSAIARQQAAKRLDEYLSKGLEARKSVGIGTARYVYPTETSNTSSGSNGKSIKLEYGPDGKTLREVQQ